MTPDQRDQLFAAIERYNRGAYFEAQQEFETLFNQVETADRALLRALMTLATGMHLHFNRGGGRGTLNLFRQSLVVLDDLKPACEDIATGELFDALEAYLHELQERRKPGAGFFDRWLAPKIRYR